MTEAHAITMPPGGEERLTADEPFGVDVPLPDLLPRWAR